MIKDSFSYIGEVRTKIVNNGVEKVRKHYNNGTNMLFKLYSIALAGYSTTDIAPHFVDIRKGTQSETLEFETVTFNGGTSSTSVYLEESNKCITRISVSIPGTMIKKDFDDNTDLYVVLVNSKNDVFAYVKLEDTSSIKSMSDSTELVIEWDLYVINKINEQDNNTNEE